MQDFFHINKNPITQHNIKETSKSKSDPLENLIKIFGALFFLSFLSFGYALENSRDNTLLLKITGIATLVFGFLFFLCWIYWK